MKVTSVERQKKNPKRFNVFLDGVFGFGADEDTIVNFRLIPGKNIEKEDLERLLFETEVGKLMESMYSLFSIRQRSEKEIRDYLRKRNFESKVKDKEEVSELVIERLIEVLKQKNMLNDLEFARTWVESRSKKKGWRLIEGELYKKGISKEIIEEVSRGQGAEGSEMQYEVAEQQLLKRLDRWKNLSNLEKKRKIYEFLTRRGFDSSIIKALVEKYSGKEYNIGYGEDE